MIRPRRAIFAIALAVILASAGRGPSSAATAPLADEQICDSRADYYLGMEDYPKTVQLHQDVIRKHPDFALAYYHLGFAYGMLGDHERERADYQRAVELGLNNWDLFLNLGRLYLESDDVERASNAFRLAILLGPYQPETHYNLGLAYEREGEFEKAEQEILLSLRLKPQQPDARNTLGLVYAEEGNFARAHEEWAELAQSDPSYTPARSNLAILKRVEGRRSGGRPGFGTFTRAP
jgi:tetratricopeptide (TPR) repeat protein